MRFLFNNFLVRFPRSSWVVVGGPFFLMVVAVSLVGFGIFKKFIFGEKLLIFTDIGSDTFYGNYAIYYFLTNYISDFKFPLWSFKLGAGSSLISLYHSIYDPFSIVYYFGGVDKISRLIVWVFLLKTFFASVFTYVYLRYLGVGAYSRIIASILFSFSGFLMIWGQHYHFASWVIFLPLMLYAAELWLKENKFLPLALCVSYMVLNIAIFFQVSIFFCLYIIFRVVFEWGTHSKIEWCRRLLQLVIVYAFGMGLSAALWFPEYYLLKSSPRIAGDFLHVLFETILNFTRFNTPEYYWSLLARLYSSNLQGVGSEYNGFLNYYESIQLYVGMLPLIVIPQLYVVFTYRAKWIASLGILLIASFLIFSGFSQVMNGFQYQSYRWGYNVIMFELLLAALVLDAMLKNGKINIPILMLTWASLFFGIACLNFNNLRLDGVQYKQVVVRVMGVVAFMTFYSGALYYLIVLKNKKWIFLLLLSTVCLEQVIENKDSFLKRSTVSPGIEKNIAVNFFDYGNIAAKELKKLDSSLYRIEKNHWLLSLNDALIQDYFGLDSYVSIINPSYVRFAKEFGYVGKITTVKWNSLEHPYLADMLSVKYHLTKDNSKLPDGAVYYEKYGDVFVYFRSGYLPFGFTYDSYIPFAAFNKLVGAEREVAFLHGAVLDLNTPKLKEVTSVSGHGDDATLRGQLTNDVLKIKKMDEDAISGSIYLAKGKLLFLSIPFDSGWSARVNGVKVELVKVNVGFSGLYLEAGRSEVELKFFPPYMKAGIAMTVLCLLVLFVFFVRSKKINRLKF